MIYYLDFKINNIKFQIFYFETENLNTPDFRSSLYYSILEFGFPYVEFTYKMFRRTYPFPLKKKKKLKQNEIAHQTFIKL